MSISREEIILATNYYSTKVFLLSWTGHERLKSCLETCVESFFSENKVARKKSRWEGNLMMMLMPPSKQQFHFSLQKTGNKDGKNGQQAPIVHTCAWWLCQWSTTHTANTCTLNRWICHRRDTMHVLMLVRECILQQQLVSTTQRRMVHKTVIW